MVLYLVYESLEFPVSKNIYHNCMYDLLVDTRHSRVKLIMVLFFKKNNFIIR